MRCYHAIAWLVLALAAAPVGAQKTSNSSDGIEEIIITAEKREADLQDTPIAVSAFSSSLMDDLGILGTWDVTNFTPSMSYNSGPYTNRVSLRGIGRVTNELGADPGVAVYVDGVYSPFTAPIGGPPFWIERTEVLRGPQGTLYGRNAMGGAVNIITQRPTEDYEGELRLGAGNYELFQQSLAFSGPVPRTETLRFRLLGVNTDRDGWFRNKSGSDIGELDEWYLEGQIEWSPAESFNVWFKYAKYEIDSTSGPAWPGIHTSPFDRSSPSWGFLVRNPWQDLGPGSNPSARDVYVVDYDEPGYNRFTNHNSLTLHASWRLGAYELRYIGGYEEGDWSSLVDWDGTSNPATQYFITVAQESKQQSHELQLHSQGSGRWQWQLGLYYFDEQLDQPFTQLDPFNPRRTRPFLSFDPATFEVSYGKNPEGIVYHQRGRLESEAWAVYGQLGFDLSDRWHFTAGLRYSYDEKTGREHNEWVFDDFQGFFGSNCDVGGGPFTSPCAYATDNGWVLNQDDWDAITWRLEADYRIAPEQMIYGVISTGYKSGGFKLGNLLSVTTCIDPGDPASCQPEDQVDEESVVAYEIGYKATLADTLRANLAAYYYDYRDFQVPVQVETASGLFHSEFLNAEEAESYGFEAELTWLATSSLTLRAVYSYQETEITDMGREVRDETDSLCSAGLDAPSCALTQPDGNELPMSPHNKLTLNATYRWESSIGTWIFGSTYTYNDHQYYSIFNDSERRSDSWRRLDLRASWESAESWRVIGYLKNATDEEIIDGLRRFTPQAQIASPGIPRLYGVELHYLF